MTTIQPSRSRVHHIDGMKGLMCFLIMLGHFWNIYRDMPDGSVLSTPLLDAVRDSILTNTLLNATFWLYAFLVISGYLLSYSRVESLRSLLGRSVKRFLRFFIPVWGACIFIFVIQETIGFHTAATQECFTSSWYQGYYRQELGWKALLLDPLKVMFFAGSHFNAPFWVVRDMFLASVLVYACSWACHRWPKASRVLPWLLFILSVVCLDSRVIFACLAGYVLRFILESMKESRRSAAVFFPLAIAALAGCALMLRLHILPRIFNRFLLFGLFHCLLLACADRCALLQKLFSAKLFLQMNRISFGVYSFHWPAICSLGSLALLRCIGLQLPPEISLLVSLSVSVIFTVLLSVIYYHTVEKATGAVLKRIP